MNHRSKYSNEFREWIMRNSKIYRFGLLASVLVGTFALQPISVAHAGDCLSLYKNFYVKSKKPHRAMATTSGAYPNSIHPTMSCGAAESDVSRQVAVATAMRFCKSGMKSFHVTIPCGVYKSQ